MKFRTNKIKPSVGMEFFLTLSMPVDLPPEVSAAKIKQFAAGMSALANETGAVWVRMRMTGIPEELEDRLQSALDEFNAIQAASKPKLQLIIDNG